jgi:hypothetical protein
MRLKGGLGAAKQLECPTSDSILNLHGRYANGIIAISMTTTQCRMYSKAPMTAVEELGRRSALGRKQPRS